MAVDRYRLGYEWRVAGSIEDAFYFISHIRTWPDWWPEIIVAVQSEAIGDTVAVGQSARMQAKSFLPYHLDWLTTVRRLEPPCLIEVDSSVRLSGGFGLQGIICFELRQAGDEVIITNSQEMDAARPLPWPLKPLAARLFQFNHGFAMARGQVGLQAAMRQAIPVRI